MGDPSSIVFAGIVPHPPIMVPEIGHDAISEVRSSIDAMAAFSDRLIASQAETLVLISPHAPLDPYAFVAYPGPSVNADFAKFHAPEVVLTAAVDGELLVAIAKAGGEHGLQVISLESDELDHGTAVPLYFLQRNGWAGDVVCLGYTFLDNDDHLQFGACLRVAAERLGRRIAVVASGDLSHRLKEGAPAGYNPSAHLFDEEVVEAITASDPDRIINMQSELRRIAGECGYRSMLIAFGAAAEQSLACRVLSYEAPFGVGYMVAQIAGAEPAAETSDDEASEDDSLLVALTGLARKAIETYISSQERIEPESSSPEFLQTRAACFVSIKTVEGDLRGCLGTIDPARRSLDEEIITNAISAATVDPRFRPVTPDELPNLRYAVDVLSPPEPARRDQLDPKKYGVIVEDEAGLYRGLLLPDIEGVDSVAKQVEIATRKAGIPPGTTLKFSRFRVRRFRE